MTALFHDHVKSALFRGVVGVPDADKAGSGRDPAFVIFILRVIYIADRIDEAFIDAGLARRYIVELGVADRLPFLQVRVPLQGLKLEGVAVLGVVVLEADAAGLGGQGHQAAQEQGQAKGQDYFADHGISTG